MHVVGGLETFSSCREIVELSDGQRLSIQRAIRTEPEQAIREICSHVGIYPAIHVTQIPETSAQKELWHVMVEGVSIDPKTNAVEVSGPRRDEALQMAGWMLAQRMTKREVADSSESIFTMTRPVGSEQPVRTQYMFVDKGTPPRVREVSVPVAA